MAKRKKAKKTRTLQGKVEEVSTNLVGDELTASVGVGDSIIAVDDTADFSEAGGFLQLNQKVYQYATIDDDASTITLATGVTITEALPAETLVLLHPPTRERWATVRVNDRDEGIMARVPNGVGSSLDDGIRDPITAETATIRMERSEWVVVDLVGLDGIGQVRFMQDSVIVAAQGDQTMTLTELPIDNSEHLYWNGLYQPGSEWSRYDRVVSIPDPGQLMAVGEVLTMEYAYFNRLKSDYTLPDPVADPVLSLVNTSHTEYFRGPTTMPLPASAQPGDLVLMVIAGGYGGYARVSDSRFPQLDASFGNAYGGILGSDLSPISIDASDIFGWTTCICVALRGVRVAQTAVYNGNSPLMAPQIDNSLVSVILAAGGDSTVAGGDIYDASNNWTPAIVGSGTKAHTYIASWTGRSRGLNPSSQLQNLIQSGGVVTVKLEAS